MAREDGCEVDVVAGYSHGTDDFAEELPCRTLEGLAKIVFVPGGGVADEHQIGPKVAPAEEGLPVMVGLGGLL